MTITGDHAELVIRAVRWLRNTQRCTVVLYELTSFASEVPDAIGWQFGRSHLVECKVTRSDFLADAAKPFRRRPEHGMGQYRWYMCPATLIETEELPARWGLLWVYPNRIRRVREAMAFDGRDAAAAERPLLLSALRRLEIRGDLERIYSMPPVSIDDEEKEGSPA